MRLADAKVTQVSARSFHWSTQKSDRQDEIAPIANRRETNGLRPASHFLTFNPHDGATPAAAERTLHTSRNLTQSFQLGTDVTVSEIDILFVRGNSGNTGRLRIFDVADATALDITADSANTPLLDIQFIMPAGLDPADNTQQTLRLSLSGADVFSLPARTGPAGYAFNLTSADGASEVFTWRFGDPGTGGGDGWYADGRVYYDDFVSSGTTEGRRDGLFAFNPIPEPATVVLVGLGAVALLGLRRRR